MNQMRNLALITGASSGIGLELAKQFVAHGYDLIINAEDGSVEDAARQLRADDTEIIAVHTDLRTEKGLEQLYKVVIDTGRPLDAAVLNAGVGRGGAFLDTALADELEIIDLNVRSTVQLAKLVLRDMAARNEGKILVTSSIASTTPGSFQAVYNASKSFLQSFAEALQNELKDTGITITSLMPGPTETNFFHRANMDDTRMGQSSKDDPAQVAQQGFEALMHARDKVVAGSVKTKAQGMATKILPDSLKAQAHRRMAEPDSGGDR